MKIIVTLESNHWKRCYETDPNTDTSLRLENARANDETPLGLPLWNIATTSSNNTVQETRYLHKTMRSVDFFIHEFLLYENQIIYFTTLPTLI